MRSCHFYIDVLQCDPKPFVRCSFFTNLNLKCVLFNPYSIGNWRVAWDHCQFHAFFFYRRGHC